MGFGGSDYCGLQCGSGSGALTCRLWGLQEWADGLRTVMTCAHEAFQATSAVTQVRRGHCAQSTSPFRRRSRWMVES